MAAYSGPGFVLYEGTPVLQSSMVSMDNQTNNNSVKTQLLGRSGMSPGAKEVQISVNCAVPASGLEFDWIGIANAQVEINLAFKIAGKTYNCTGDVRDVKLDSSVDKANEVSFTFSGIITSTV